MTDFNKIFVMKEPKIHVSKIMARIMFHDAIVSFVLSLNHSQLTNETMPGGTSYSHSTFVYK